MKRTPIIKNVFACAAAMTVCFIIAQPPASAQDQATKEPGLETGGVTMNFRSSDSESVQPLAKLKQQDPSGLLAPDSPLPTIDGNTSYSSQQNRQPTVVVAGWAQPGLRHRKLYFEDSAIEQANQPRQFGNLASGIHFFKSLFRLPLRLVSGR